MNDDDIKDLLDSTAPAGPDLPAAARADAVRGRARAARRRNGLVLAAAVVAVVGIGAGIAVVGSGDEPGRSTEVAGDPSEPAAPPVVECPAEPTVLDQEGKASTAEFPDGASSLRLCPATFDSQQGTIEFTLVQHPVTADVDALIDEIAAQPVFEFTTECAATSIMPMPWTMVVGYPDGSTVSVGNTSTACASITVDGREVDVDSTLGLVQEAAVAASDRDVVASAEASASAAPDPAACPELRGDGAEDSVQRPVGEPDTFVGDLAELDVTSAAVCYGVDPLGMREYADTQGSVDGLALDLLVHDIRTNTTASPVVAGRCTDTGPVRLIVLSGAGGQVTLTNDSCTSEFAFAGGYWLPGDGSEDTIAAALGGRIGG